VQRGAKVLEGDRLPFIHLTELDIVKVGMSGGSNAGPVFGRWGSACGSGPMTAGTQAANGFRAALLFGAAPAD
jgi:hypothetical protein